MGKKTSIAAIIAAVLLAVVVGGAYAYDSSQKDEIAEGVTIGGVDVGGRGEGAAQAALPASPRAQGRLRRRDLEAPRPEAEDPGRRRCRGRGGGRRQPGGR